MTQAFKLPELGEGVESGEVISVLVKQGDAISDGDSVLELESEKATAEVPFDAEGTVTEVHVSEGDTVKPGDTLLTYEPAGGKEKSEAAEESEDEAAEKVPQEKPEGKDKTEAEEESAEEEEQAREAPEEAEEEEAEPEEPQPDAARAVGAVMATPSVRRLARALGVNIHAVEGTGPHGRILEADVKAFVRELLQTGADGARQGVSPVRGDAPDYDDFGPVRRKRMNAVRRTTAKHMAEIWTASPRVTNFDQADFTAIQDARERLAARADKVSLSAILVKLVARALRAHPKLNATVDMGREQVVVHEYVHVGVAVDTPRGLLVPVVRDADRKDVHQVHEELAALADKARDSKLGAHAMRGGTFTLSNLGGLGGGWFTPIVNVPEVAILGVGRARLQPVYADGAFAPRPLCPLSLSYDHRLVDGADAARFLGALRDAMENPLVSLLEGDST